MQLLKYMRTDHWLRRLKSSAALVVLFLYILGSAPVTILHQYIHSRNVVEAYTVEREKNPCDRSVYETGRIASCGHQAHIVKIEKCNLCGVTVHNDHVVFLASTDQHANEYFSVSARRVTAPEQNINSQLPARAPPVCFPS
jgi:hypothetical protein